MFFCAQQAGLVQELDEMEAEAKQLEEEVQALQASLAAMQKQKEAAEGEVGALKVSRLESSGSHPYV
jgi:uncharacterized protein YlxW (UPF0749 family)